MTKKKYTLLEVNKLLRDWRIGACIPVGTQVEGFPRNVMEELGELAAAIKTEDTAEILDAIGDICVFAINAYEDHDDNDSSVIVVTIDTSHNYGLAELLKAVGIFSIGYKKSSLNKILSISASITYSLGYNFQKVMLEVAKVVTSRRGKFNPKLNKFEKYTDIENKSRWYTADFNNAKY